MKHPILRNSLIGFSIGLFAYACTVNNVEDDDESTNGSGGSTSDASGGSGASGGGTGASAGEGGETNTSSGGTQGGSSTDVGGAAGHNPGGSGGSSSGGSSATGGSSSGGSSATGGSSSGGSSATGGSGSGGTGGGGTGGTGGTGGEPIPDAAHDRTGPLVLQITTADAPAVPGQHLYYTVTVGNTSNVAVDNVSVLLRLPEGLQFNYTQADPNSTTCGNGICSANEEATWNLGSLPPGGTQSIRVNPEVLDNLGDGDSIASVFRLSATDVNTLNLTKTDLVSTAPEAEISLSASADPVVPGQSVELEVDLGQVGNLPLSDGELLLELPPGLTLTSISDDGNESAPGQITWPVDTLAVGETLHRSVRAQVRDEAAAGDILNPRVSFDYDGVDVLPVAQVPLSVVGDVQPLTLTLMSTPMPAAPDGLVTYRATIANRSLRAVDGIQLVMYVPRAATYTYTTHADPNSTTCGNGICTGDEEASWSIGTLPAGTTTSVTLNPSLVDTLAGDGSLVSAYFALRSNGSNTANQYKTLPVHGQAAADLTLGTLVEPVTPGQSFSYMVDLGQVGAQPLTGSTLQVELPEGVDVDAISDSGTQASRLVTWDLGSVPVGAHVQRSIDVTVAAGVAPASVLKARAALSFAGGWQRDAASEHLVSVVASPLPLTATFEATPDPAVLDGRILYTTTVTNNSARAIDGVNLLLRVPTGLQYAYAADADPNSSTCGNGICTASEEATWSLGSLAPGASQIVTVNPAVASTLVGGTLITTTQRISATDLGGTIHLQLTVPTVTQ